MSCCYSSIQISARQRPMPGPCALLDVEPKLPIEDDSWWDFRPQAYPRWSGWQRRRGGSDRANSRAQSFHGLHIFTPHCWWKGGVFHCGHYCKAETGVSQISLEPQVSKPMTRTVGMRRGSTHTRMMTRVEKAHTHEERIIKQAQNGHYLQFGGFSHHIRWQYRQWQSIWNAIQGWEEEKIVSLYIIWDNYRRIASISQIVLGRLKCRWLNPGYFLHRMWVIWVAGLPSCHRAIWKPCYHCLTSLTPGPALEIVWISFQT